MATASSITKVQQMYVGYYGRPADPDGLTFWADLLDANGGDITSIIDAFGASDEYNTGIGTGTTTEQVTALYQQMFNRAPEQAGLDFWVGEIDAGNRTLGSAAAAIAEAAQGDDKTTLDNKVAVATYFTDQVTATGATYAGSADIADAQALITGVTSDASTITSGEANSDAYMVANPAAPTQGQVITLTSGIDIKDGTDGDDVFDGLLNSQGTATLNSSDVLDGKGGNDKLIAEVNAATTIATTTKNIQSLELIATAAGTFDTINASGLEAITIKNGVSSNILTVSNIASTDIAITQLNQAGDYTLNYSNTALTGASNVALTLNGAQSDALVGTSLAGGAEVIINQQAGTDTSGAETVTLDSIGTNANFLARLQALDGNSNSDITTLTVTGGQTLTVATAFNASVATVDASALAGGGLVASFANTASNMSIKGGSGNDRITLTANNGTVNVAMGDGNDTFAMTNAGFNTLDVIDGGDGTDTLSINSASAEAITATLANVSSFEGLILNTATTAAGTVNATFFGDIETTSFTAAASIAGAFGLTMAAGPKTINIGNGNTGTAALTDAGTLTVTDTGTATDDVLTINNSNTAAALDALSGSITSKGYETVNINTGSVFTATQALNTVTVTADSTSNANTINFSGINLVTLAGAVSNGSGDFTIDASGLTGTATLVMGNAATHSGGVTGTTVITGSNNASDANNTGDTLLGNATAANTINAGAGIDTVTGGAVVDTIDLGTGNDILNSSTGNDVITGGEGNDTMTAGVGEQSIKGDAGNDTIIAGATVSASDVFTGGDGTDTLSLSAAVAAANAAGITEFETLALAGASVTQDMIQFTNNSGFVTAAVGSTHTFIFNNAGSAFNTLQVTDFAAGADTVTAATVSRLVDTTADMLTINGGGTVSSIVDAGATTITTVTADNEETININGGETAAEDVTIGTLNANDVKSMTLTGAGDVIISTTIAGASALATVDGSGVTGAVTVDGSNSTAAMTMTGSLAGVNTLTGGTGADSITGGSAADTLTGGNGGDTISGGAANDTLLGGLGNDTIDGGVGDDAITGGVGADALTGGLGVDTFAYTTGDGSAAGAGTNSDTIADFKTGTDKINIATGSLVAAISDVTIAAAQAADTNALAGEDNYFLTANGAAANLTTAGTATLTTSDLTATSLTNVATYLGEQFATANTTGGANSIFALNWTAGGSTSTYIYHHTEDNTNGILAAELSLLAVVERGGLAADVLVAGDFV